MPADSDLVTPMSRRTQRRINSPPGRMPTLNPEPVVNPGTGNPRIGHRTTEHLQMHPQAEIVLPILILTTPDSRIPHAAAREDG
ncbi:hypothetical protein ES703_101377 [subsurface metagenome]